MPQLEVTCEEKDDVIHVHFVFQGINTEIAALNARVAERWPDVYRDWKHLLKRLSVALVETSGCTVTGLEILKDD